MTTAGTETLRWLVERLAPLADVADALDKIGSLDLALAERKAAYDAAVADHAAIVLKLGAARSDLAGMKAEHAQVLSDHQTKIQTAIDDATAQANGIVAAAKTQADGIVASAHHSANNIAAQTEQILGRSRTELSGIRDEIAAAKTSLAEIHAEHDSVNANIAAMQETAKSILKTK